MDYVDTADIKTKTGEWRAAGQHAWYFGFEGEFDWFASRYWEPAFFDACTINLPNRRDLWLPVLPTN